MGMLALMRSITILLILTWARITCIVESDSGNVAIAKHQGLGFNSQLRCELSVWFYLGLWKYLNHVKCTTTKYSYVTQLKHVELMCAFNLIELNRHFFHCVVLQLAGCVVV